ncbi:glycosyltransferase involved in cell wall biosynthesis [Polymorphobacter multimanifer]|uniref:Glycosyltransferase involved in cell wall biosynthesis n=1 Tax=Polymorphobacter multimanifer TaxID=1070431 RepID=A0A841L4N3_9SPHN|nr:glycosyltransferase family 2 protein [Polymorphobacter multimanifer]MBB6226421.1 glycosyltransferase involved in cell wall biosynthesis [Polymorphobacter multimanifer]
MMMGDAPVDVTAIICTRNRAASLERVLASAATLRIPDGTQWELLVVDNGSTDSTASIVAGFADRLPIRRVAEPVAGLSHARNRGVAEARGALICWTDDDVELDGEWLAAYVAAAARHPEAAFFAGNVTPVLEGPTPDWFARLQGEPGLRSLMARRTFDSVVPLSLEGGLMPYGANFAVRAAEQKRYRYDPDLGVSPQHRRSGEETQLVLAIIAAGGKGFSVPASNVRHLIPAGRQSRRYIWSYYRALGETWALLAERKAQPNFMGPAEAGQRRLFGVPLWVGRAAASSWLQAAMHRMLGRDAAWLRNIRTAAYHWGAVAYLFSRRSELR